MGQERHDPCRVLFQLLPLEIDPIPIAVRFSPEVRAARKVVENLVHTGPEELPAETVLRFQLGPETFPQETVHLFCHVPEQRELPNPPEPTALATRRAG
jgi:hypothetical protein